MKKKLRMSSIILYRSNKNNSNNNHNRSDTRNIGSVARGSSLLLLRRCTFIIVGILMILLVIQYLRIGGITSMLCSKSISDLADTEKDNDTSIRRTIIEVTPTNTVTNKPIIDLIDLMKASADSNQIQQQKEQCTTSKEMDTKIMVWMDDWTGSHDATTTTNTNTIPKIIHQTSKSWCVTKRIAKAISKWKFGVTQTTPQQSTTKARVSEWSYYLHDDTSINYLFQYGLSTLEMEQLFPNLQSVVNNCILYGTIKADLWRYVVLWIYGGIYVDIDAIPNKVRLASNNTATKDGSLLDSIIDFRNDDAVFVVEQYHLLSQWFMVVSPRHPIIYYAIQYSLINLLQSADITRINAAYTTGPHALHKAYQRFRMDYDPTIRIEDAIPGSKPVVAGYYIGTNNRTIKVIGTASDQNEYIIRDILGRTKTRDYAAMNMTHFLSDKQNIPSNISCMKAIFDRYSQRASTVRDAKS